MYIGTMLEQPWFEVSVLIRELVLCEYTCYTKFGLALLFVEEHARASSLVDRQVGTREDDHNGFRDVPQRKWDRPYLLQLLVQLALARR